MNSPPPRYAVSGVYYLPRDISGSLAAKSPIIHYNPQIVANCVCLLFRAEQVLEHWFLDVKQRGEADTDYH